MIQKHAILSNTISDYIEASLANIHIYMKELIKENEELKDKFNSYRGSFVKPSPWIDGYIIPKKSSIYLIENDADQYLIAYWGELSDWDIQGIKFDRDQIKRYMPIPE